MYSNFKAALAKTLVHEGGWSDNPLDPGGATMKGITLPVYRSFVGVDATKDDLRKITDIEVESIYLQSYWNRIGGNYLPSGLDICVFDFAVNSGVKTAVSALQKIVGSKPDGVMGTNTMKALFNTTNAQGSLPLITQYNDARLEFLKSLNTFVTFGKGWSIRVKDLQAFAKTLS
jgi:lysozyme family protein